MGNQEMINKELIVLDMGIKHQDEFFKKAFEHLFQQGYCNEQYYDALKSREEKYPTALPTIPYAIALPHTDPDFVKKPFIYMARLKDEVPWLEMGTNEVANVKWVFLLGFERHCDLHIRLLQRLMNLFEDATFPKMLLEVNTTEECYDIVYEKLKSIF